MLLRAEHDHHILRSGENADGHRIARRRVAAETTAFIPDFARAPSRAEDYEIVRPSPGDTVEAAGYNEFHFGEVLEQRLQFFPRFPSSVRAGTQEYAAVRTAQVALQMKLVLRVGTVTEVLK
ncbi:MAG TPA: hypothetical protein VK399_01650 [Longimicrobiaceae bacterium]|nr:hypothetical protein [Longimicrobiaceae bacterium]